MFPYGLSFDDSSRVEDSFFYEFIRVQNYMAATHKISDFFSKLSRIFLYFRVEIRIQFRHVPGNLYREQIGFNMASNELIIAIQPNEAIYLKINNKVPGLGTQLDSSELNLLYRDKYEHLSLSRPHCIAFVHLETCI